MVKPRNNVEPPAPMSISATTLPTVFSQFLKFWKRLTQNVFDIFPRTQKKVHQFFLYNPLKMVIEDDIFFRYLPPPLKSSFVIFGIPQHL